MERFISVRALAAVGLLAATGCVGDTIDTFEPAPIPPVEEEQELTPVSCLSSFAPELTDRWSCLADTVPLVYDPPGEVRRIELDLEAYWQSADVAGAELAVCASEDVSCLDPAVEALASDEGHATLYVPSDGPHVLLVEPSLDPLRYRIQFQGPPVGSKTFRLVSREDGMNLSGRNIDETRGHLYAEIEDCTGQLARRVQMRVTTADDTSFVGYVDSSGRPDHGRRSTSRAGVAGAVNLPVGPAQVRFVDEPTGCTVVSRTVEIQANTVTTLETVSPRFGSL